MELSKRIYQLRSARGLSQQQLAERLGVSRQSVSKWETGQAVPDLDRLIGMADLFAVSMDQLVRGEERPAPPEPAPPEPEADHGARGLAGLTLVQKTGCVFEIVGAALALLGTAELDLLLLLGALLVVLGLPLLLSKRHPWLWLGWLVVGASLLVLNPYTSVVPWGLVGGLNYVQLLIRLPELRYHAHYLAAAVGIVRGTAVLVLLWRSWLAWKKGRGDGRARG